MTTSKSCMWEAVLLGLLLAITASGVRATDEEEFAADVAAADEELGAGSIDDLIAGAANSSLEFDIVFDAVNGLMKVQYDMIYPFADWNDMQVANGYSNATNMSNLTSSERRKRTAGIINGRGGGRRWTNNIVPYQLSSVFSSRDVGVIRSAINDWQHYTCLTFREQSSGNRIYMKNGGGCYSRVGMVGGAQDLGLAPGCRHKGVVIHELGHALGLHHEQTRPDRDEHVSIIRQNIPARMYYNFQKNTWNTIMNMGIPYDYTSIMHYGKTAFSQNGQLTIRTRDPAMQNVIGNRHGLSFGDIKSVNIMYNCKRHQSGCTKNDADCPGQGFVGKDCTCICPGGSLRTPSKACGGGGGGRTTRPVTSRPTPRPTRRPVTRRPTVTCTNRNPNCGHWANAGECNANPNYMLIYCKQSCGRCGSTGGGGRGRVVCRNKQSSRTCMSWRYRGYCRRGMYRSYVRANCMATCGVCRQGSYRSTATATATTSCYDYDSRCPAWATNGECTINPLYMRPNCRLSCRVCTGNVASPVASGGGATRAAACTDSNTSCAYWAGRNQCRSNPGYMNMVCRRSCGVCT